MSDMPAVDPGDFTEEAIAKLAPVCNECGPDSDKRVVLVRGSVIYPNRLDLADGWYWRCPCRAYCGVHKTTFKALGTPAGRETRAARQRAHAAFDPLWRRKMERDGVNLHRARGAGYKWLAAQLGMERKDCHIGSMTRHDADRVTALCSRFRV